MFSRELLCPACGWRTVSGLADAVLRLRLVGVLRREKEPDEAVVAELLAETVPRMSCPVCKSRGLRLGEVELDDDGDWQAADSTRAARIPSEHAALRRLPRPGRDGQAP